MSESIDLENIHLAKIGVILDMDNGLICFLNPDSNNDIVSYPRKKHQNYSLIHITYNPLWLSHSQNDRLLASSICGQIRCFNGFWIEADRTLCELGCSDPNSTGEPDTLVWAPDKFWPSIYTSPVTWCFTTWGPNPTYRTLLL